MGERKYGGMLDGRDDHLVATFRGREPGAQREIVGNAAIHDMDVACAIRVQVAMRDALDLRPPRQLGAAFV